MPPQGLAWLQQDDFSAGAVRSIARHLIPPNGAYSIDNGLLDDDGSVYRRGGSKYLSNAAMLLAGLPRELTWMWSGHLAAGPRTVFASDTRFGVLAADDATPIEVGVCSDPSLGTSAVVNGMLFLPGGYMYGGSRRAPYSTGTIDITQGSKVVTGTGTSWLANVDPGMLLKNLTRWHVVASVDSDTQVTLADPIRSATVLGGTYLMKPLGSIADLDTGGYRTSQLYATIAERLVTVEGARIYFSNARSETGELAPHVFSEGDYHELAEGAIGLAAAAVRDLLVVFSTDGIWTINNMAFDLTDAAGNVQQQMQRTSQDLVLWGTGAIADYRGNLVVAATDGVYLVDGVSPPVSVSDSITPLLVEYARLGRKPGTATVFNGHYFLPIRETVFGHVVDLLVCRLDRPVRARRGTIFPWTWFSGAGGGHGADICAFASRVAATGTSPQLLGAGHIDGRVHNLSTYFTPDATNVSDANGVAHEFMLETRDFPTGTGNVNTVRRLRARYVLVDGGTDDPVIGASYSTGDAFTVLTGDAPEDTGQNKHTWHFAAASRFIRVRLQSTDPAATLVIRSVEIATRPSNKDR